MSLTRLAIRHNHDLEQQGHSLSHAVERLLNELTDRRHFVRYPSDTPLQARLKGRDCVSVLFDISQGGGRIGPLPGAAGGDRVAIRFPDNRSIDAHVAWVRSDAAGIAFDAVTLAPDQVEHMRNASRAA